MVYGFHSYLTAIAIHIRPIPQESSTVTRKTTFLGMTCVRQQGTGGIHRVRITHPMVDWTWIKTDTDIVWYGEIWFFDQFWCWVLLLLLKSPQLNKCRHYHLELDKLAITRGHPMAASPQAQPPLDAWMFHLGYVWFNLATEKASWKYVEIHIHQVNVPPQKDFAESHVEKY